MSREGIWGVEGLFQEGDRCVRELLLPSSEKGQLLERIRGIKMELCKESHK